MEKAAKYVYTVYEEKSFSKAAKKLFIAQPSLSITVARLEEELGFSIFDRSVSPISLTPQGKIYIEHLEEILRSESTMKLRMEHLSNPDFGTLTIGVSSFESTYMLPVICREYKKRFPNIHVTIDGDGYWNLFHKLKQQRIDLFFSTKFNSYEHSLHPVVKRKAVIAMREEDLPTEELLRYALTREEVCSGVFSPEKLVGDLSLFSECKFIGSAPTTSTYKLGITVLEKYDFSDTEIIDTPYTDLYYRMMCDGLGAVITYDTIVAASPAPTDKVLYFVSNHPSSESSMYILTKRNAKIPSFVEEFIKLSKELCKSKDIVYCNS